MTASLLYPLGSFLAGFVLMGFEILSARIIAPLAGNSLYSWAAVIGATLLGLSLGAWRGGVLADTGNPKKSLIFALLSSSLLIGLVPIIAFFLTRIPPQGGIVAVSIVYSLVLFLPTSFSLGMIQPLLLKTYTSSYEKLGRNYGMLSMLWSLGSIMGVMIMGFILISLLGVTVIITLLSALCYLYALALLLKHRTSFAVFLWAGIIFVCLTSLTWYLKNIQSDNVVFEKDTSYYHVRVTDFSEPSFGFTRGLFLDYDIHSMETTQLIPTFYTNVFPLFGELMPAPKNILVIGAGAYTLPKHLSVYYKTPVDVFEIDPELPAISKEYFGYNNTEILTTAGEARMLLRTNPKQYDLIFGDAYNSFISLPWHLTTKEYYELTKKRLSVDGIYAMSFIATRDAAGAEFLQSMVATFKSVYPNSYVLSFSSQQNEETSPSSIVLVGINAPVEDHMKEDVLREKLKQLRTYSFLSSYVLDEQDIPYTHASIFTDDYAPVEARMRSITALYFKDYSRFVTNVFAQKRIFFGTVENDTLLFKTP